MADGGSPNGGGKVGGGEQASVGSKPAMKRLDWPLVPSRSITGVETRCGGEGVTSGEEEEVSRRQQTNDVHVEGQIPLKSPASGAD